MGKSNHRRPGGVGQKLFLAFLSVSLFSIAAALVGGLGLSLVRDAQDRVLYEVYPLARDAQLIARYESELVLELDALSGARALREAEARIRLIREHEQRIQSLTSRLSGDSRFHELGQTLAPHMASLSETVGR
ncbi:MAG: hypothetical protein AAGF59_08850, partial [Pseudomonadota bacterium]